jgi:hypothetical protein
VPRGNPLKGRSAGSADSDLVKTESGNTDLPYTWICRPTLHLDLPTYPTPDLPYTRPTLHPTYPTPDLPYTYVVVATVGGYRELRGCGRCSVSVTPTEDRRVAVPTAGGSRAPVLWTPTEGRRVAVPTAGGYRALRGCNRCGVSVTPTEGR